MQQQTRTKTVHHVLANSYLTYCVALVLGVVIDYFYPLRIMSSVVVSIGPLLLILATMLIFWAQHTSNKTSTSRRDPEKVAVEHFCKGPYCYTRSPTHLGLGLMVLGFGFVMNSVVIVITAFVVFVITRYFFIVEEEKILLKQYGDVYAKYQQKVKL